MAECHQQLRQTSQEDEGLPSWLSSLTTMAISTVFMFDFYVHKRPDKDKAAG